MVKKDDTVGVEDKCLRKARNANCVEQSGKRKASTKGDGVEESGMSKALNGDGDDQSYRIMSSSLLVDENGVEESAELRAGRWLASPPPGEEVVVSGMAGVYPNSDNIYHLRDNLMNKVDMITCDDRRWNTGDAPDTPSRTGKINTLNKFDLAYFGIHPKLADVMDPMNRILLEKTYEAILDAGVNPVDLQGTRTAVFVGCCYAESECNFYSQGLDNFSRSTSKGNYATRISYWLKVNGPSWVMDTACSSGSYALDQGYKAIRDGLCDQAIVASSNLCMTKEITRQFYRLGVINKEGRCFVFDERAQGYARSEAVAVAFLQKTKDAKRVYATLVHSKTNCDGYKNQGITYPSRDLQQQLLENFYQECQVDPSTVDWIEAHGTGTEVGDPEECSAIDAVFCKNRTTPLPIGSIKSNLGHSEPSSGLCSLTKVIIAMETGLIPPNINFEIPKKDITSVASGRLQVVTEPQPWTGGLVPFNSFGFGGANSHVLLRWNEKEKIDGGAPKDGIPRLVGISGRTEQAVKKVFDVLSSRPVDAEYVRLYHDIHSKDIPGHLFRGYTILLPGRTVHDIQYVDYADRPLWLVFSGLDSHWGDAGQHLQVLPAFSNALEACHRALRSRDIDVRSIVAQPMSETLVERFIGVTALQICLVEVLRSVKITSAGLLGHSLGEIAAAYADDCLTIDQAMLTAYYIGLTLREAKTAPGTMARVGLALAAVQAGLPHTMDVACSDSSNSCTVSGPLKDVTMYVNRMKQQGVTAERLDSGDRALHSRHLAATRNDLIKRLKKVIPLPKVRKLWISTSDNSTTEFSKLGSAEYFANTLLAPVLFEEASRRIPKHAIMVEISPSSILRDVLTSVSNKSRVVSLLAGDHDATHQLLRGLGEMFMAGVNMQLARLYPDITFPVSRGTPMISPHIGWNYSRDVEVKTFTAPLELTRDKMIKIEMKRPDSVFYLGHVVDGRSLFPATGYIWMVAQTLSAVNRSAEVTNIVLEDIRFHRATNVPKNGTITFGVSIHKTSGNFEVEEGGMPIVTGRIYIPEDITKEMVDVEPFSVQQDDNTRELSAKDVYKELRLRGYNYSGLFKSIHSASSKGEHGKIRWSDNWVAFMDNMLQLQILAADTRGLFVPTSIDKVTINSDMHNDLIASQALEGQDTLLEVTVHPQVRLIRCGGIEFRGLNASGITRKKPLGEPVLERYTFMPNTLAMQPSQPGLTVSEILRLCVHVALENQFGLRVKAVEITDNLLQLEEELLAPELLLVLGDLPLMQSDITVLTEAGQVTTDLGSDITVKQSLLSEEKDCMFVLGTNLLLRSEVLKTALDCVADKGFLIIRETSDAVADTAMVHVLNEYSVGDERILLMKKVFPVLPQRVIHVKEANFDWISTLQEALNQKKSKTITLLVAQGEPTNGIIGLFNCLRREANGAKLRCYSILDADAPAFDPELPLYKQQIAKDLAVNVLKDGAWGSYRHLKLAETPTRSVPHAYANTLTRGDLASLRWLEGPLRPDNLNSLKAGELVHVYYASLNFRDIMIATGKIAVEIFAKNRLDQDCVQGFEFSGRTSSGTRVMGMIPAGAMSTIVQVCDQTFMWEVPDQWTLEEAATVPVVYGTALYALMVTGHMIQGDSVLIHAGSGGVGQAAISLALHAGCTVYTTVGSQEKRDFIKQTFPQLTDRHIGNSRDTSFEHLVMSETNGRGVDLVLNSLSEEKLQASVRCLAVGGRFLEIGKFDLSINNPLGMNTFLKETSFHGVMLDNLFGYVTKDAAMLNSMLSDAIKTGAVRPLPRTVFKSDELKQAFRYLGSGKHIGKVLLHIRQEEQVRDSVPQILRMSALPRHYCDPLHSYIIAGGLGGFGLELADWLVLRGARKLVLTSRTGVSTGYQSLRVNTWRSYNVSVLVSTADITQEQGVVTLLQEANQLGPVAAIFNLAVVLADAMFDNQNAENYVKAFGPKAAATRHLDTVSRRMCPQLTHFVIFSSVSCGRGNAGQTNYGMANSVMERIVEQRVAQGYPGLAIQWGAVGEVGLVADMQEDSRELVIGGTLQQRISSCLQVLDGFLKQSHAVVASMVVAEKRAPGGTMLECVANILGFRDLKTVSFQTTLADLGMDSMTAVEIKQTLEREYQVFLTPQEMRSLTLAKVVELSEAGANTIAGISEGKEEELLQLVISHFENEDITAEPLVLFPSVAKQPTPILFMIPGVESVANTLQPLATNLRCQTVGLQLGYSETTVTENIKNMAERLVQYISSHLTENEPFYLLGYSYGSLIGLHMALLLEQAGHQGELFFVDGAPDYFMQIQRSVVGDSNTDDTLQIALLTWIMQMLNKENHTRAESATMDLIKLSTWEERLDFTISAIPDSGHRLEYVRCVVSSIRNRMNNVETFAWPEETKLRSSVTLLRPTYATLKFDHDFGLAKYCVTAPEVHLFDASHITILESTQVADILNARICPTSIDEHTSSS